MADINLYLREHLGSVSENVSVSPNIPEKKLNNAVVAFGYGGGVENVIALYDNTKFGSGKNGLLFTGEQVIYRQLFSSPIAIPFESIQAVEYKERTKGKNLDKVEPYVAIVRKDDTSIEIDDLINCDYLKLAEILQKAISEFNEFKEESQILLIEDMAPELKVAYVKVIVNMAFDSDGVISDKGLAEILMLMTRIKMDTPRSRLALRTYMANKDGLTPTAELIATIDAHIPEGHSKIIHMSLVKDLINTYFSTTDEDIKDISGFPFFNKHRHLFRVSDAEVDVAIDTIRCDRQILKEDISDAQIVKAIKMLSAKAAAVGVPLAAVYLSGSVIGLSAAGITSGLAALGMGGILGMSSMVTGIGVAVLIGVGAYAGVRKLTGVDEQTRFKRRELMLQEVVKQIQSSISMLMQDINYITRSLNEAMANKVKQDEKIRRLQTLLLQLTSAGSVLVDRSEAMQASANKLRCATYLNEGKLRLLTREPTKAKLFDFIRSHYEEREVDEADGSGNNHKFRKLVLKSGYRSEELEKLARAFETIGYFKLGDVLKGTTSDAAAKAKEKLMGLFS